MFNLPGLGSLLGGIGGPGGAGNIGGLFDQLSELMHGGQDPISGLLGGNIGDVLQTLPGIGGGNIGDLFKSLPGIGGNFGDALHPLFPQGQQS